MAKKMMNVEMNNNKIIIYIHIIYIQAATDDAPPPTFVPVRSGCSFTQFSPVTVVIASVKALSDKQCASDPLPTRLLKDNIDLLAPFLVELFNRSLLTGSVPAAFKDAYVTPRLKKADLDPTDTKSYRPISNLSVLSKLLERLVARQLLDYLTTEKLQIFPLNRDSGFKSHVRHP